MDIQGWGQIIASEIQLRVSAIAMGQVGASPALAEMVVLLAGGKLQGDELGALVGAVAEGLGLGQSARAIVVVLSHHQLLPTSRKSYCLGHLSTAQGSVIFCFSASVTGSFLSLDWSHPIQKNVIKILFSDRNHHLILLEFLHISFSKTYQDYNVPKNFFLQKGYFNDLKTNYQNRPELAGNFDGDSEWSYALYNINLFNVKRLELKTKQRYQQILIQQAAIPHDRSSQPKEVEDAAISLIFQLLGRLYKLLIRSQGQQNSNLQARRVQLG